MQERPSRVDSLLRRNARVKLSLNQIWLGTRISLRYEKTSLRYGTRLLQASEVAMEDSPLPAMHEAG